MKRIIIIFFLCSTLTMVEAQYELQFNQLIKSIDLINPGYNAIQSDISGTLVYSNQWNSFPGSPSTAGANFHVPIRNKHLGFGALFFNETLGHRELRTVGFTVDADIRIGSNTYFTAGVMGGSQIIDYNIEDATTSYIESLDNIYNYNSTIVGSGLNLFVGHAHLGFSAYYHITATKADESFLNDLSLYSNASYWFRLDDTWRLKAAVLYKSKGNYASIAEGGAFFLFKDIFWLGASYRYQSASIMMADVKLSRYIRMGYSYAMGMGPLANFTGSSHEIQLHLTLPGRENNDLKSR